MSDLPDGQEFDAEFPLCDTDGTVRRGAMYHGTNYPCTGHAHYAGQHIRCTSPAHTEAVEPAPYLPPSVKPEDCRNSPHRGPQGPNEDLAACFWCGSVSYVMRPWGETFGWHTDDCSLPIWHESYCEPGGTGHPAASVIRGYWPTPAPSTANPPQPGTARGEAS